MFAPCAWPQVKTLLNSIAWTWSGVGAYIKSAAEPGLPVPKGELQLGKPVKQKLWLHNWQGNGTIKRSPKWLTMTEKCSLLFCDAMDRTVQGLWTLCSNVVVKSNICVFGKNPSSVRGERAQTLTKALHLAQVVVCADGLLFGQRAIFFQTGSAWVRPKNNNTNVQSPPVQTFRLQVLLVTCALVIPLVVEETLMQRKTKCDNELQAVRGV